MSGKSRLSNGQLFPGKAGFVIDFLLIHPYAILINLQVIPVLFVPDEDFTTNPCSNITSYKKTLKDLWVYANITHCERTVIFGAV
ncbi:MAG: hypothetical protein HS132_16655 [Planctomycetia bacterium]|nr:hypothetical protein [Planctomycetia bacterium]